MCLDDNVLDSRELLSGLLVVQVLQTGPFFLRCRHQPVVLNRPYD